MTIVHHVAGCFFFVGFFGGAHTFVTCVTCCTILEFVNAFLNVVAMLCKDGRHTRWTAALTGVKFVQW